MPRRQSLRVMCKILLRSFYGFFNEEFESRRNHKWCWISDNKFFAVCCEYLSIQQFCTRTSLTCRFSISKMHYKLLILTHCGPVTPYGDIGLGQHSVRQWPVTRRLQKLTEPIFTYHQWDPLAFSYFTETLLAITHYKIFQNYVSGNIGTSLRGQWVNILKSVEAYMSRGIELSTQSHYQN